MVWPAKCRLRISPIGTVHNNTTGNVLVSASPLRVAVCCVFKIVIMAQIFFSSVFGTVAKKKSEKNLILKKKYNEEE